MQLFHIPSFAFLTSLLLVLPPSGCGDWLRSESVASAPTSAAHRGCCGSKAAVDHSQPAHSAVACHSDAGHTPCAPLQSVCDCCDAAEGTVPTRTTPPIPDVFFVAQTYDSGSAQSTTASSLNPDPVCPRLRLHILKCVWRC